MLIGAVFDRSTALTSGGGRPAPVGEVGSPPFANAVILTELGAPRSFGSQMIQSKLISLLCPTAFVFEFWSVLKLVLGGGHRRRPLLVAFAVSHFDR